MEISWRPARLGWTLGLINFGEKNKFLLLLSWSLLTFLQSNRTIKTPTKKAGVGNIHGAKTLYNCPHPGRCQLHNNFLPFFLFPLIFSFWISISGQTESGRAENMREESSLDVFLSIYCDVIYTDMKILYQSQKCSLLLTVISSPLLNLNSSLQNLKQKDVKYFHWLWITFFKSFQKFFFSLSLLDSIKVFKPNTTFIIEELL